MKLHNVVDVDGMFTMLDRAEGEVMLETEDGAQFDWTSERNILRSMSDDLKASRLRHLSIHFGDARDANEMIRFLMEQHGVSRRTA